MHLSDEETADHGRGGRKDILENGNLVGRTQKLNIYEYHREDKEINCKRYVITDNRKASNAKMFKIY